jgi:hypothetical protein
MCHSLAYILGTVVRQSVHETCTPRRANFLWIFCFRNGPLAAPIRIPRRSRSSTIIPLWIGNILKVVSVNSRHHYDSFTETVWIQFNLTLKVLLPAVGPHIDWVLQTYHRLLFLGNQTCNALSPIYKDASFCWLNCNTYLQRATPPCHQIFFVIFVNRNQKIQCYFIRDIRFFSICRRLPQEEIVHEISTPGVCVMNPSVPYCVSKIFTWTVSL